MLRENFEGALALAIRVRSERDKEQGIESCAVAGLKEVLEASERNEEIVITRRDRR